MELEKLKELANRSVEDEKIRLQGEENTILYVGLPLITVPNITIAAANLKETHTKMVSEIARELFTEAELQK